MNSDIESLVEHIRGNVAGGGRISDIRALLVRGFGEEAVDSAIVEYERRAKIVRDLRIPPTLIEPDIPLWYPGRSSMDRFWPALEHHLRGSRGLPDDVVQSVNETSQKIVSLLGAPGSDRIDTRGLVLGYVQSGKTTNFTGVMATAADVGYRLFIVLSGIHNGLRNQTQMRLQSDLADLHDDWLPMTEPDRRSETGALIGGDFKRTAGLKATTLLAERRELKVLAVVKKNATILRRLRDWLREADREVIDHCPVLIIDDEADQASVNAGNPDDPTVINGLIREMLDALPKAAYIGYTATPFANVLIDPTLEDLYPKDFIVDLPRPDNYFGPERIFGRDPLVYHEDDPGAGSLDLVRTVEDLEVTELKPRGHRDRAEFEPRVTPSLARALRYFWMATAARWARGDIEEHSSMLVHTTMYTSIHDRTRDVIDAYRRDLAGRLTSDPEPVLRELRQQWEDECSRVPARAVGEDPTSFEGLEPHMRSVLSGTRLVVENNESDARLEYGDSGSVQIVVGGNTLSRGLTLEGLVASFFIRAAGTYDTLLQMGRWFGYRAGYADLPRIWLTRELQEHFRDLSLVEYEIRRDIGRYEAESLRPSELAVRIRRHPALQITSRLKMQAARTIELSYSGQVQQTILFEHRDEHWLRVNREATESLITALREDGREPEPARSSEHHSMVFRSISPRRILEFLRRYQFHPAAREVNSELLIRYIQLQNGVNGLVDWSVAVVGASGEGRRPIDLGLPSPTPMVFRSQLADTGQTYANIGALTSPGDLAIDQPDGRRDRGSDTGLLLIYPVDRDSPAERGAKRVPLDAVDDLIGVAFVLPSADRDTPGYVSVQPLLEAVEEPEPYVDLDAEPEP